MEIKPSRTLLARLNMLRSGSSDFADELDEITDKISTTFPEHPSEHHLYIFVVVPVSACEWTMSSCMRVMLMLLLPLTLHFHCLAQRRLLRYQYHLASFVHAATATIAESVIKNNQLFTCWVIHCSTLLDL
jgi:hypothetical protein